MEESEDLPPAAREALGGYLAALDAAIPGFADGVYLTGSAALGDWVGVQSDLDLLVVSAQPVGEKELDLLGSVHDGRGQPFIDAVYVTWDQIGLHPGEDFPGVPAATDGKLDADGNKYVVNPVLWATLARHAITVRGPGAATLDAEPDPWWLREWNVGNLAGYWTTFAAQMRELLPQRDPESAITPKGAVWGGTGPGRLHKTIATGRIISKTECASYVAQLFPEYTELLARVRAARLGSDAVEFTATDGLLLIDLIDLVIEDAARL
jgi:hypothetical protein